MQTLYLEDEGRAGLQLQHPCGAERLKDRVWVVDEIGGVDDQQGLDIIHDKANLIRAVAELRRAPHGVVNGGSVAHHGGVIVDGAVLREARNEVRPTPNKAVRVRPHKDPLQAAALDTGFRFGISCSVLSTGITSHPRADRLLSAMDVQAGAGEMSLGRGTFCQYNIDVPQTSHQF